MTIQTILDQEQINHIKTESIKIFGKSNISGYISKLVRDDMRTENKDAKPTEHKNTWKHKQDPKTSKKKAISFNDKQKKKPLTPQELQNMVKNLQS